MRHPRPRVAEGICYGRTDLDLEQDPLAVAACIRGQLPANAPVFSSPLRRCLKLAKVLSPTPRIDAQLVEMDFGAWEMRAWSDIGAAALDRWAADPLGHAPPGGESPAHLVRRATAFYQRLVAESVTEPVVVTHAGIIRALCGLLQGLPDTQWMSLRFDYGSVTVLEAAASS